MAIIIKPVIQASSAELKKQRAAIKLPIRDMPVVAEYCDTGFRTRRLSNRELRLWGSTGLLLTAHLDMPMINVFGRAMELRHCEPDTPANADFQMVHVTWEDMAWLTYRIPTRLRPIAETLAAEFGLYFADGYPNVPQDEVFWRFPLHGPNVWTLHHHQVNLINPRDPRLRDYEADLICQEEDDYGRRTGKGMKVFVSMPVAEYVTEVKPGWQQRSCPECGRLCYFHDDIAKLVREKPWNRYQPFCTLCVMAQQKAGGRHWNRPL